MGKPEEDPGPAARALADAQLARQDQVAAETLDQSATNLNAAASTFEDEGYADAAAVMRRAASEQLGEAARYAIKGEELRDAAVAWGTSANAVEQQAKELGQSLVGAADRRHALVEEGQPFPSEKERANAEAAEAAIDAGMRAHHDKATGWGQVAVDQAEIAIQAEQQAYAIHPEVAPDPAAAAAPEQDQ